MRTFDDAYAVQAAFRPLWDDAVVGRKVGCSSEQSQRLVNSPGPIAGVLFRDALWRQPATLSAARFFVVGVEAEFGFRLGRDLPARSQPYEREEVSAAVDAGCRSSRSATRAFPNGGRVAIEETPPTMPSMAVSWFGSACESWRSLDLASHIVTLSVDGKLKGEGTGALVLGHPLIALTWLANEMSRRGDGMHAGELVAAGTCTGLHFVQAGSTVVAAFGAALGEVTIQLAE